MSISKNMHHSFTEFFSRPSKETLRPLLQLSIGETNNVDYKELWPDKDKLAKHVLAIANSGGGILILGVLDGEVYNSVGLKDFKDKTDVGKQLTPYIPANLRYEVFDFDYGDSENTELKEKKFQVLMVDSDNQDLPYMALKSGSDLKNNAVYVRRDCSSTEANHQDLQALLDSRIATQATAKRLLDLDEHCEQLKVLYSQVKDPSHSMAFLVGGALRRLLDADLGGSGIHHKDEYKAFIKLCIERKKERIEKELDL